MNIEFRFEEYNPRRAMRGADAARVSVIYDNGEEDLLWMSRSDIKKNMKLYGDNPELKKALDAYKN